jgi:membrane AbrB-like protein
MAGLPPLARWRAPLLTLGLSLAGGALFAALGLPAGWLSGAMVAMAVLVACGGRPEVPGLLRDAAMLVSGVAMGAAVTPEMLRALGTYPLSVALLVVAVVAVTITSMAYLMLVRRADVLTALFASVPGALSAVMATAADTRADLLRVSAVQSFRLFVLVAVLPPIVAASGAEMVRISPHGDLGLLPLGGVLLAAVVLQLVFQRLGLPGAAIFGGMLVSAGLHATEVVTGNVPALLANTAFMLVGAYIGTRFIGLTGEVLRRVMVDALGAFVVGFTTAVAFAVLAAMLLGRPFGEVLVAYAPGGLEAMIVLGAALGLDPIYVGLHHLVRFVGISFAIPVLVRLLRK